MSYSDALQAFQTEKPRKTVFGNYRIEGDSLIYRASCSDDLGHQIATQGVTAVRAKLKELNGTLVDLEGKTVAVTAETKFYSRMRIVYHATNVIARKLRRGDSWIFLGNGSILPLVGRRVAYGNEQLNHSETDIQRSMRNCGFVMIPFSVFAEAKLDLNTFESIERGPEETLRVREKNPYYQSWAKPQTKQEFIIVKRHFVGAALFKVGGTCFLFDVDRREVKHRIFNPFLVKLSAQVTSIKAAYASLKPKAVIEAEKRGVKVLRQGEWFFIPSKAPRIPKLSVRERMQILLDNTWSGDRALMERIAGGLRRSMSRTPRGILLKVPRPLNLSAGDNRPNTVEMGLQVGKVTYATGMVSHSGREHAELQLKGWYQAVPNTSVASFTITGDVD